MAMALHVLIAYGGADLDKWRRRLSVTQLALLEGYRGRGRFVDRLQASADALRSCLGCCGGNSDEAEAWA
jgi:hypothetical protein